MADRLTWWHWFLHRLTRDEDLLPRQMVLLRWFSSEKLVLVFSSASGARSRCPFGVRDDSLGSGGKKQQSSKAKSRSLAINTGHTLSRDALMSPSRVPMEFLTLYRHRNSETGGLMVHQNNPPGLNTKRHSDFTSSSLFNTSIKSNNTGWVDSCVMFTGHKNGSQDWLYIICSNQCA